MPGQGEGPLSGDLTSGNEFNVIPGQSAPECGVEFNAITGRWKGAGGIEFNAITGRWIGEGGIEFNAITGRWSGIEFNAITGRWSGRQHRRRVPERSELVVDGSGGRGILAHGWQCGGVARVALSVGHSSLSAYRYPPVQARHSRGVIVGTRHMDNRRRGGR